jgi:hypothetical protein
VGGRQGDDVAPSDDRGTETNRYRERLRLEPMGQIDNHEQTLWGQRYSTVAFRLGEACCVPRGDGLLTVGPARA